MKKTLSLFLLVALLLSVCSCGVKTNTEIETKSETETDTVTEEETKEETVKEPTYTVDSEKTLKMFNGVDEYRHELNITKFKEYDNVAYVESEDFMNIYCQLIKESLHSEGISLTCKYDGNTFTATRENGATMIIDSSADTFTFSSFDEFSGAANMRDGEYLADYGDYLHSLDENVYLVAKGNVSYTIQTQTQAVMDLTPYYIDIIQYNGKIYLPFQLVSNLILSPIYKTYICFDDAILLTPLLAYTNEYVDFYRSYTVKITDDLLKFNYYETCFNLDTMFGLYEYEYNTPFDELFIANGLKDKALESVRGYDELLDYTMSYIIDDAHTIFVLASPQDTDYISLPYGQSKETLYSSYYKCIAKRQEVMGDNIKPYEEIGNTAYITCDGFNEPCFDNSEYELDLTKAPENLRSTVYVFAYAYRQITRENSPIENVVIDISCNGGGDTRTLAYALGFFMDEVVFCSKNKVDNSISFSGCQADCNLDTVIDEKDKLLLDKNIFVIESNCSYSCANIFANMTGQSGAIMLGEHSGGGSCMVYYPISALGAVYRFSGPFLNMNYNNGIYEPNDKGMEVDFALTPDQMYDRDALTDYINTLVK